MQTRKCKSCNKRNSIEETLFIWVYSFCDNLCYNNYQKENKSSPKVKNTIRKVSLKKKQRIKEWWSEVEVFKEIWNERKHECEICWKTIIEAQTFCFAHRCPKWTYPEHRLKKENISLVCSIICHHKVDKIFSWIKRAELNLILKDK